MYNDVSFHPQSRLRSCVGRSQAGAELLPYELEVRTADAADHDVIPNGLLRARLNKTMRIYLERVAEKYIKSISHEVT